MRDELEHHGRDDVDVVVITFGRTDLAVGYRRLLEIPFAVLHDATRDTYRAYDLARGSRRAVHRPATIAAYIRLRRAGWRVQRATDDTRQLGGDFVVGADGRLRFAYRPVAPDDRPSAASIVAALPPRDPPSTL